MTPYEQFRQDGENEIAAQAADPLLLRASREWMDRANAFKYSYHFEWLGRPVIQYPQDIVAVQELIWKVQPDLVIETGVAHGGSLILSASMLALLDYRDAAAAGTTLDPSKPSRRVIGIDIDIRPHNRAAIEAHPMASRITLMQGSSIDTGVVARVRDAARDCRRVLVFLDSNHTHQHVLAELEAYAPLTTVGSYCCVFDTVIEDLPADMFPDRPWGPGNNPKTAVREYLRRLETDGRTAADGGRLRMRNDLQLESKLLVTVAPEGFLERIAG